MIIDYSFTRCISKINIARQLRAGQEQFCQLIEYYIRLVNDFRNTNPVDPSDEEYEYTNDAVLAKLTKILEEVRKNINYADRTFSKVELYEQARVLTKWFDQQQIENIVFPNVKKQFE